MAVNNNQLANDDSDMSVSEVVLKRRRITTISSDEYTTDCSNDAIPLHLLPMDHNVILSSSEEEEDEWDIVRNLETENSTEIWSKPTGNQPRIKSFVGAHSFKLLTRTYEKVEDIYSLLLDDKILEIIVLETNRYAEKLLLKKKTPQLLQWKPTNKTEIRRLLGIIMWMGLVKLPEIHLYWSKDPAFTQSLPSTVISRNRFQLLLRMLYFCDIDNEDPKDRLYKIRLIMNLLNENFRKYYDPGEFLCVDEYLIPFRGRIAFKRKIKKKTERCDIKIFKLCSSPGYTFDFKIYCRKKTDKKKITPTKVVLSLCKNVFGKGHTLCTDSWFTSIDLARELNDRNTHLVGIIRSDSRGIPKDLVAKKLNHNEYIAKESMDGLTILKWKNKRDVLLLSSKHSDETMIIRKNGYDYMKLKIVMDYNEGKSYADTSDQMSQYCNPLHKSMEWYKKIVLELLLNIAVVNAWVMHNNFTNNKISSIDFRKQLAMSMMYCEGSNDSLPVEAESGHHEIKKKQGKFDSVRKRCKVCYECNVKKFGSKLSKNCTVKVITFCDTCPTKPHLCLPCFNKVHRDIPIRKSNT